MTYFRHVPALPLSDLIHYFWFHEGYAPPHVQERVFPTGTLQIIFNLGDNAFQVFDPLDITSAQTYRDSVVNGPRSGFTVIGTAGLAATMGVHFKPGGALPFFGIPASDLRNRNVPLDTFWGLAASEVAEQVREAPAPGQRFQILEAFLRARLAPSPRRHPAVAFGLDELHRGSVSPTIAAITERASLSHRRFNELFQTEVGLSPKQYQRVRRFQQVIHLIDGQPVVDWARIAAECGYADQSHLIREMRALGGVSPTEYVAQRGAYPNHVGLVS